MGDTITRTCTLNAVDCCSCGVPFAMPDYLMKQRRQDHDWFYCPNGHSQHYTAETEAEKLKGELAQVRAQRDTIQAERDRAEKKLLDEQAAHQRISKRTRNGVCEACNRSFENLQRHMKTKHAELLAVK